MKKHSYLKLTIILSVLALVFLGLSIGSAFYTVNRCEESIDNIGKIVVDSDNTLTKSKNRLDKAISNYEKLDRNLKLEKKIDNIEVLYEKEKEFVNVSIILAKSIDNQKVKLNKTEADVAVYVKNIDDYKSAYITDEEFKNLASYSDYEILKEKYKDYISSNSDSSGSNNNQSGGSEEVEIC